MEESALKGIISHICPRTKFFEIFVFYTFHKTINLCRKIMTPLLIELIVNLDEILQFPRGQSYYTNDVFL